MKGGCALALTALALTLAGPDQVFRGGVDAVRVDVLVTDGARPIAGLTADDFDLRDSGVPQRIRSVSIDDVPVSMLMALDTSTSVEGPTLTHLKGAARAAFDALGPEGRAGLLTFDHALELGADWGTPAAGFDRALERVKAAGTTSVYDAAFAALTMTDPEPGRRGLIVLFSDGDDTSSWLPRRAALEKAARTDVVLYSVVLRPPGTEAVMHYRSGVDLWSTKPPAALTDEPFVKDLADLTGGSLFVADRRANLGATFTRIVTEFRNRYVLTYSPEGVPPGGWHPLEVRLKKGRGTLKARRGYFRG